MTQNPLHQRHHALHRHWAKQARNDSEYGGPSFRANLAVAKQVLNRFGNRQLTATLEKTGWGSHPELIRFLWKVGQALQKLKGPPRDDFKAIADLFYPGFNGQKR
jgi:hypothetical protein